MDFNSITEEKLLDFKMLNNGDDQLYIKPIFSNYEGLLKFKIMLGTQCEERTVKGFICFYVDAGMHESQFIGMKVDLDYRQKNYANLLLSTYIRLCNDSSVFDLITYHKQRKPEVLHILKKFGYEVYGKPDDEMQIIIIDMGDDQKNVFYIPNRKLRNSLENSKLAKQNNYRFVNSINGETILDTVYYSQPYRLVDHAMCLRKQHHVKSHFNK